MTSLELRRLVGAVILAPLATIWACKSANEVPIGNDCDRGFCDDPPSFTPTVDGGDVDVSNPSRILACIGTECPAPYTTCNDTPALPCGTNLSNDPNNCGACGVSCLGFDPINMSASCVLGQCAFECINRNDPDGRPHIFKNCNQILDDGCEIDVTADPANCGVCGNACGPGVRCINGKCGCSGGRIDCNGLCVDSRYDDAHCGRCNNSCYTPPPDACDPMPDNTRYGCGNSECGALKCDPGWMDCNNDTPREKCGSDGCETNIETDPKNCGGCGIACGPGQECRDEGVGPQCLDTCETAGLTQCLYGCEDLLRNPYACGSCENSCPNPRANQAPAQCRKGVCEVDCLPGYADCNGDPSDGCEIDLRIHPAHCGACGNKCDFAAGQPCINGACLMVECDAGVPTR